MAIEDVKVQVAEVQDLALKINTGMDTVLTRVAESNTQIEALQVTIAELQAQIEAGGVVTAADLAEVGTGLDAAKVDLSAAFSEVIQAQGVATKG